MTRVNFFVDPVCPWTWITSRWLIAIAPERDLEIRWRSFSTEVRDGEIRLSDAIPEQIRAIAMARRELERTVLRVFEIVRRQHGEAAVGHFYTELGYRLNDPNRPMAAPSKDLIASALAAAGLGTELERLADDPDLQTTVRESTEEALAIVGQGALAPVLILERDEPVGISGPVISPMPIGVDALRLWDAVHELLENSKFFEVRRARSRPPAFPVRPEGCMANAI